MDFTSIKDKAKSVYGGLLTWQKNDVVNNDIGIYFDIITDHSISITNSVTDNYLENNSAIQDCIAHAPIEASINGMSGELVYVPSTSRDNPRFLRRLYQEINSKIDLKKIGADKITGNYGDYVATDKLSALGQLFPPVDNLTQLAKNKVVEIEDSIDRYKKIYKNFTRNLNDETRLQHIYKELKALRDTNTALIVTTPFTTLYDMYFTSLEFNQGNENHVASISMSFKQLNFTWVEYKEADKNVLARYTPNDNVENNGKADGKQLESIAYQNLKNKSMDGFKPFWEK